MSGELRNETAIEAMGRATHARLLKSVRPQWIPEQVRREAYQAAIIGQAPIFVYHSVELGWRIGRGLGLAEMAPLALVAVVAPVLEPVHYVAAYPPMPEWHTPSLLASLALEAEYGVGSMVTPRR